MKLQTLTISALIGTVFGAPAIVWNNGKQKSTVFSSEELQVSALVSDLATKSDENSLLAAALFVVGKTPEGTEHLSHLTSSGKLPLVASKYDKASVVHSHAAGIKTSGDVARECVKANGKNVLEVSLDEFHTKMASLGKDQSSPEQSGSKREIHRAKMLEKANIIVINVPASTDPSKVDQAVFDAVENRLVNTVVLAGQRSNREVRTAREAEKRRKMVQQHQQRVEKRRRLDDANDGDDSNDNTLSYYVPMTPNIFAGILFTLFFSVVTMIGLSQLNNIQGQTVFVTKMPTSGREA